MRAVHTCLSTTGVALAGDQALLVVVVQAIAAVTEAVTALPVPVLEAADVSERVACADRLFDVSAERSTWSRVAGVRACFHACVRACMHASSIDDSPPVHNALYQGAVGLAEQGNLDADARDCLQHAACQSVLAVMRSHAPELLVTAADTTVVPKLICKLSGAKYPPPMRVSAMNMLQQLFTCVAGTCGVCVCVC